MTLMHARDGRSSTPGTRPPSRARWGSIATAIVASLALVVCGPVVSPAAAEDPVEIVAPADAGLTGEAVVDGILTLESSAWQPESVALDYAWHHSPTAYQPPVEGVDQNPDAVLIAGAETASLALTAELAGRYVWVEVTGTADGLEPASIVVASTSPVAKATFSGVPAVSIAGTPRVGTPLTAILGATAPDGAEVAYQWLRDGVAINAATASYTPAGADFDHVLSVTASFAKPGYTTATSTSTGVTVKAGTLVPAMPTLSGVVRVDSVVTVTPGVWLPGTTFAYQWRLTDTKNVTTSIAGATAATFTPTAAMRGKRLSVVVTASQLGYTSAQEATSLTTIGYGVFAAAPVPKITGNAHVGSTLKISLGTFKPAPTVTYQWKRDGKAITGATKSSYTLTKSDLKKKITVMIVAKRTGYTSLTRTSTATATVTTPFTTVKTPTISGTARAGSTLKASVKAWKPTASFSYQWKRNGVAIKGATKSSYKLTTSDSGKVITVSVAGKKSGYFTRTVTSKGTAKIAAPNSLAKDGLFKVGVDIAPGTYVSRGGNDCYFERRRNTAVGTGDGILGWTYRWNWGMGGQKVITISSSDVYFYTELCGTWKPAAPSVKTSLKDGTWVVGKDLKPGIWRPYGPFSSDGCYIEVLKSFTGNPNIDILTNYSGTVPRIGYDIRIPSNAKGFTTDGCGTWKRVGN